MAVFKLEAFLANCPAALADDVRRLHELITRAAPSLAPVIQGSMLAYGRFRYRYETGREGDSARVSVACRKSGLSIYVNCVTPEGYVAEQHAAQFPKAKVGKSCIAFKRLADLDAPALTRLMKLAAKTKGVGEVSS
ncbi:MAG: hypothetical protein K0R38_4255 [Polyangiaceae bacterium]|jgi:hypothetical protein|nr:hypothetical protein [Polyangiaceae bacterium]